MNQLYSGSSIGDRGTLAQLKQEFNHRSLKKVVKENVQQVWDMLEVNTHIYIAHPLCDYLRSPGAFPHKAQIS